MQVFAPTSKVGYFVYRINTEWQYCAVWDDTYHLTATSNPIWAISNKSPTVKSNGRNATSYYRKIATLVSHDHVDLKTSSHKVKGSTSIHARGLSLANNPHGSPFNGSGVAVPQWMVDKAIQDCIIDLNGWSANLLEDFAQAKQTANTAATLFNTIVKLFLLAVKGKWRQLRRTLRGIGFRPTKKIANGWLMYYYGIRPLVSTLESLMDDGGPKVKTKKVKRKIKDPLDPLPWVSNHIANGIRAEGEAYYRVLVQLMASINQDSSFAYWSKQGFSGNFTDDALVLAWAITPYSFVVDWILPVERFLRTRTWAQGVDYLGGFVSRSQTCDARYTVFNAFTGTDEQGDRPRGRVKAVQFNRTPYNSWAPPSGLSLKLSLSPTNLVNASALIIQRR